MKIKVSISIEEDIFEEVGNKVEEDLFRNKSHFIEYSVRKCLKEDTE